ncbi:hypothetical protein, partial [Commensalibacter sp. Nvir]|uniref:hypothetical protein n=1 Tax=Commensalibacter sp. Nvir TaxID=3069817 RepID=UPI0030C83D7C
MNKKDYEEIFFSNMGQLNNVFIQSLRAGLIEVDESSFLKNIKESRIKNNLVTLNLCNDLKKFVNSSENWFYIKCSQNDYLILKTRMYAFVFKIRNSNPIDTQNLRNKLSNGRENWTQNANIYIANQVNDYLNKPCNKLLKKELSEYKSDQICFFHLVWSLSKREINRIHVGITYTVGYKKENNLDWYLHLISDRIKINADEEHIDVLVNETSGREEKANIIKVKRR